MKLNIKKLYVSYFLIALGLILPLVLSNPQKATALGTVTVTGVAVNNSSAKVYYNPVAGAKDYRIYDITNPNNVKYAGWSHITPSGDCPGNSCFQHFLLQADGVTPVFPYVATPFSYPNGGTGGPQVLDVPATEIEYNSLGDNAAHTLVVEAVDKLGPAPLANLYTGAANTPLAAGGMLGSNKGSTPDGKTSTNGQGPYTNNPTATAISQGFIVQANPNLKSLPSKGTATQVFFDSFEQTENSSITQLSRSDCTTDSFGNLGQMQYSMNGGTAKAWDIIYRQANNRDSMPFISSDHFMDMIFDGATPSCAAPTHTVYGSMAMSPVQTIDITGGKIAHISMEVDGHQDINRRWMDINITPASDPLKRWDEFGGAVNNNNQSLFMEMKDGECSLNIWNGPAGNPASNPTKAGSGFGCDLFGNMYVPADLTWNGLALDERSRYDFFFSATHAAFFVDGKMIKQGNITPSDFPWANQPMKVYFSHYIYHSSVDVDELRGFSVSGRNFCYPMNSYWFNDPVNGTAAGSTICNIAYPSGYGFPYSDERHWDNMGFEVLAASDAPATDFSSLSTLVQPIAAGPVTFSGSPTPPPPPPPPSDLTPPTVSISAPASGATVSGASVAVTANASDNVGVAGVQFKLDGVNLGSEDTTSPYAITWDSNAASNASHTLTAVARDTSNNTATSSGISVTVNNVAGASQVIFDNTVGALVNGWSDCSSGSPLEYTHYQMTGMGGQSTYTLHSGTYLNGYLGLCNAGVNFSSYNALDFYVLSDPGNGTMTDSNVAFRTTGNQTVTVPIDTYIQGGDTKLVLNKWEHVVIPISALNLPSSTINRIAFVGTASSSNFYIMFQDAVKLVSSASTTPPPPPPPPNPSPTPPNVSITSPTAGTLVAGTLTVNTTAIDDMSISKVEFYVDGTLKGTDTTTPYNFSWDTTNGGTHACIGAHTHSLTAKAYDDMNTSTISTAIVVNMNNPSYCSANQLPVGTFDGVAADGFTLRGWSYDPDSNSVSNIVQIFVNGPVGTGTLINTQTTSFLRTDVNTSFGITGNHGFEFAVPSLYRDGVAHNYYVYGIDVNDGTKSTLLTGSPKSVTVSGSSTPPAITGLHVSGNRIVNGSNQNVKLVGVDKSGTEYICPSGGGVFDGPTDQTSITNMLAWKINIVRIPLNETCWLGINGVPSASSGTNYQTPIVNYINLLNQNGIAAIVELQWNAAGSGIANSLQPMPDLDHAPAFWTSVANTFKSNSSVIFELFNEPYPDNNSNTTAAWTCLRDGGTCPGVAFTAVGMQSLVNTIRATGATNIISVPGIQYTNVLSSWLTYKPTDSQNNITASWHSYSGQICSSQSCWDGQIATVLNSVPLLVTEIGENDCTHNYIDPLMTWMDSHNANYLAWAWNTYDCSSFPSLISNFNGTPTNFGIGFRDHLVALSGSPTPPPPPPPPAGPTPFNGPHNLPGKLEIEDFDNGGEGVAYHDVDTGNNGSATYRSGTDVDMDAITDTGGGYGVGWVKSGEWIGYSVSVGSTGTYDVTFRVASQGAGGTFHMEQDGVNVTGTMTIASTGSWNTWVNLTKTGVSLTSGSHFLKIVMDSNGSGNGGYVGNLNYTNFTFTGGTGTPLVGDINLDHIINSIDYSLLNSHWFGVDTASDLNHDGIVNAIDFSLLNQNWLRTW